MPAVVERWMRSVALRVGIHPPPGPLAGFWSWRYLDLVKTAKLVTNRRVRTFYAEFPDRYPVGSEFPDVCLPTTDGQVIDTRTLRGKRHFVLVTGAIT